MRQLEPAHADIDRDLTDQPTTASNRPSIAGILFNALMPSQETTDAGTSTSGVSSKNPSSSTSLTSSQENTATTTNNPETRLSLEEAVKLGTELFGPWPSQAEINAYIAEEQEKWNRDHPRTKN